MYLHSGKCTAHHLSQGSKVSVAAVTRRWREPLKARHPPTAQPPPQGARCELRSETWGASVLLSPLPAARTPGILPPPARRALPLPPSSALPGTRAFFRGVWPSHARFCHRIAPALGRFCPLRSPRTTHRMRLPNLADPPPQLPAEFQTIHNRRRGA